MNGTELLEISGLTVRYPDAKTPTLRNVDLTLRKGEITCVIGESGCGKSTLFHSILQLPGRVSVMKGSVCFEGRDLSHMSAKELRSVHGNGIGAVFQEPGASLNPIRKIHVQFYEGLKAHGRISRQESRDKAAELLGDMEFPDPQRILDSCPAQLSGGMNQRVAIALAMAPDPKVLLCDEATSALDVTVQAQIVDRMLAVRDHYHTCILMITHNMGVVAKMADYVAVMYGGRIVEYGPREIVLSKPAHPYTRALLEAIPKLNGEAPKGIPGKRPDVFQEFGCSFEPRCPYASEKCRGGQQEPVKRYVGENHWTLCVEENANG